MPAKGTKQAVKDSPKPEVAPKASSSEFAVVETGGKQYQVKTGEVIEIERIVPESGKTHKVGDKIVLDKVLLVDNGEDTTLGNPYITGAKVEAVIEAVGFRPKILVVKYKQKSRYLKRNGHKQGSMKVKILGIK